MSFKSCKKCNKVKPLDEYWKAAKTKDRKAAICKACVIQGKKDWIKNNPVKYKAQLERRKTNPWYKDPKNLKQKVEKQRQDRINLTDPYVKQLICSKGTVGHGIDRDKIPQELMDAYRVQIKLKRILGLTAIKQ